MPMAKWLKDEEQKDREWTKLQQKEMSSIYTSGARIVTLAANPVIHHEWTKVRIVITANGTYPWSFVT